MRFGLFCEVSEKWFVRASTRFARHPPFLRETSRATRVFLNGYTKFLSAWACHQPVSKLLSNSGATVVKKFVKVCVVFVKTCFCALRASSPAFFWRDPQSLSSNCGQLVVKVCVVFVKTVWKLCIICVKTVVIFIFNFRCVVWSFTVILLFL